MPKAYSVSLATIHNPEGYKKEVDTVRKSVTDGGGKFLASAGTGGGSTVGTITSLVGDEPDRVVIIEWPDAEIGQDWWDNGGEEEVDKLREHAEMTIFRVDAI